LTWIQDRDRRDEEQKKIFMQQVLPVIVYHRDTSHAALKKLEGNSGQDN
jgi:hypothetical protein